MNPPLQTILFAPYLEGMHGDDGGTLARALVEECLGAFARRGLDVTPSLALRLVEVLSLTLTSRRLEQTLSLEQVVAPPPHDGAAPTARSTPHPLLETLAKTQERLRKALKELDECLPRGGASVEVGIADELRPLLMQSHGVLDDALAYGK